MTELLTRLTSSDRPSVGMWVKIPSLVTLEIVAQSGFDFIVVDLEHSAIPLEWLHAACAIAQPRGVEVMVRMPDASGTGLQRVLDLGVSGVLIPQLRYPSQTESVVTAAMFAPRGHRGVAVTTRAGQWGLDSRENYVRRGDQETVRCIQFETRESFDNLAEMLDTPYVNAALLGPVDLSVALGVTAEDPVLRQLSARLLTMAAERSIPCGIAISEAADIPAAMAQGFRFVIIGNDATALARALAQCGQESRLAVTSPASRGD
jgi:2-keto-3-deoxy-L-rhamnonate aldolase RhmA